MLDPRSDLQNDTYLWELVLACALRYADKTIFGNLHGFRCGGSTLVSHNDTLVFKFPNGLDDDIRKIWKEKYATPYIMQFKTIFKFVSEFYRKHKDEVERINKPEPVSDFMMRDFFTEGFPT